MIEKFYDWIDSTYSNKEQSQSHPCSYRHVNIVHCILPSGFIYGEQKNMSRGTVYRQFILKPFQTDIEIIVKNYSFNKERYFGFKNLSEITEENIIHKLGCDTIFEFDGEKFAGHIHGSECIVNWNGQETYTKNSVILKENEYYVYDKGFSTKTHKQIWGSNHKHYEFKKIDKGYLWVGG